jgi:hypothetical protein
MSTLNGLSTQAATRALETVIPNGVNLWVGLLTTLPSSRLGSGSLAAGAVEASGSGYLRVVHTAWLTATSGTDVLRTNSGAITFGALTGDLPGIVGWCLLNETDTPPDNLIAFGPLVDGSGNPIVVDFVATDAPQLADQVLKIRLGIAS